MIPPSSSATRTFQVHAADGREMIEAVDEFPYRAVVLVISPAFGPSTGFLYGPDMLVTAGHCVNTGECTWFQTEGKYALRVGYRVRRDEPYRWCGVRHLHAADGWIAGANESDDYGAIRLDRDIGRELGWFDLAPPEGELSGRDICVIGYGMRPWLELKTDADFAPVQYASRGIARAILAGQIFYTVTTARGMSGGPVCVQDGESWRIAAIHTMAAHPEEGLGAPHRQYSHGTAITRSVFDDLMSWREAAQA